MQIYRTLISDYIFTRFSTHSLNFKIPKAAQNEKYKHYPNVLPLESTNRVFSDTD